MASTNKTTNYELSQFIGSDKPTYLGDYNSDMLKIDNAMHQNALNIATADEKATLAGQNANTALTNAGTAQTTADTANTTANSALTKATANETEITKIQEKTIKTIKHTGGDETFTSNQVNYSAKIGNWSVISERGNNITFDTTNNEFVIGSGITQIKISATIKHSLVSAGTSHTIDIFKKRGQTTSLIGQCAGYNQELKYLESLTISPILTDVQEGDSIYINVFIGENGKSLKIANNSYVTIEEV